MRGKHARTSGIDCITVGACFRLDGTDLEFLMSSSVKLNSDQVLLVFDVDDPLGEPIGIEAIRLQKPEVALYGQCHLWAPTSGGRIVILTDHEGKQHFDMSGDKLQFVDHKIKGTVALGEKRARARLKSMAASMKREDLDNVWLNWIGGDADGNLVGDARHLAA